MVQLRAKLDSAKDQLRIRTEQERAKQQQELARCGARARVDDAGEVERAAHANDPDATWRSDLGPEWVRISLPDLFLNMEPDIAL